MWDSNLKRKAGRVSSNHNFGHGHVWERPDGMKARCGGPGLCRECSADDLRLREVRATMPWSDLDIVMLLRTKDEAQTTALSLERSFKTLRLAIEREGYDVMHDLTDKSYSIRNRTKNVN